MRIKQYSYEFSVVMSVFNCEPYLEEALGSLTKQDFGFDRIQLIMVDDGSEDRSGALCDRFHEAYPNNTIVIHKENGGVASARNEGLRHAEGRFLNFMDSDDKLTLNTFSEVFRYFLAVENEVDIVTIPISYFGTIEGEHFRNDKFERVTRIIDLKTEYQATLMTVSASFISSRVKHLIEFDPQLVSGEDAKVILTILAERMKFGVLDTCRYLYRQKNNDEYSLIRSSSKKKGWYIDGLTHLTQWGIEYYETKYGYVPAFVQYDLLSDLQWRFNNTKNVRYVLTHEEIEQYKAQLAIVLRHFDDRYICEQKMIWIEQKCMMLSLKYGCKPTISQLYNDAVIHFGNKMVGLGSWLYGNIEFLTLKKDSLTIEGYTRMLGVDTEEALEVVIEFNNNWYCCETFDRKDAHLYGFEEEVIFRSVGFKWSVPLDEQFQCSQVKIHLKYKDWLIQKPDIRFENCFQLDSVSNNSYYYANGWTARIENGGLMISRCSKKERRYLEYNYMRALWKEGTVEAKEAVKLRLAVRILGGLRRIFHAKPIWLVSDRIGKADDNGEAFYRYLKEHHKEIDAYFVLLRNSKDYVRMKKDCKVVEAFSTEHKILHLLSEFTLSAQADRIAISPLQESGRMYKNISQPRFVFLQHGVMMNDFSGWLNRYNLNIWGFVTSARREYNSILYGSYGYSEQEIWLTGLPRFDRLYHDEKHQITIMPTWRMYLMDHMDHETGCWLPKEGFERSDYFIFYNGLINHLKLLQAAKKYGYRLCFFPHPNTQSCLHMFEKSEGMTFLPMETSYREVYAHSDLVITDYSSAVFDFAYLRKPIVYCQFDRDEFFSGEHVVKRGYYDHRVDGFGEVEYTLEDTVNRIIEYMKNGCNMKEVYRKRVDEFFAYNDQNNCERVFKKIMEHR